MTPHPTLSPEEGERAFDASTRVVTQKKQKDFWFWRSRIYPAMAWMLEAAEE
jgi:hypothetical protein